MASKTIFIQRYPAHGYEVRTELIGPPGKSALPTKERNAYVRPGGAYIGDYRAGQRLCAEMGIAPKLISPEHSICTIGFCEKEQKWYGWGISEIAGFGIGSTAKRTVKTPEPDVPIEDEDVEEIPYRKRPLNTTPTEDAVSKIEEDWTAKTLDDAKAMATDFAESVA